MAKIIVYHAGFNCDSGCCGHIIEYTEDGEKYPSREVGVYEHPNIGDDYKQWAENLIEKEFGEDHIKDLDWENCVISFD